MLNALTGALIRSWDTTNSLILLPQYCVFLATRDGSTGAIVENERGVWIEDAQGEQMLKGTGRHVRLPDFAGHRYGSILRALHHEILINVTLSGPVPNLYVYSKPWYRDGAMIAMCLKQTGNLDLIRDWILGLREPYDRNNAGETEADNLGQALFLISCVSGKSHPLVSRVLEETRRFQVRDPSEGLYIKRLKLTLGLMSVRIPDGGCSGFACASHPSPALVPRSQPISRRQREPLPQ